MENTTTDKQSTSETQLGEVVQEVVVAGDVEEAKREGAARLGLSVEEVAFEVLEEEKTPDGATVNRVAVFELPKPGPVEVLVSEDKLEALIQLIRPEIEKGKPVSEKDISAALAEAKVVHGILAKVVKSLPQELKRIGKPLRNVVVARGTPPVEGSGGTLKYLFDKAAVSLEPDLGGADPSQFLSQQGEAAEDDPELGHVLKEVEEPSLKQIINSLDPADIGGLGFEYFSVGSETPLMEVVGGKSSRPGKNVHGEEIPTRTAEFSLFPKGENLRISDDGTRLFPAMWGYLDCSGDTLDVLSPVRIAADKMKASFLCLPLAEGSARLTVDDLKTTLKILGIKFGAISEAFKTIITTSRKSGADPRLVTFAEGKAPVHGENAKLDFKVDIASKAGKMREDGTIDYRERNIGQSIDKGVLLAEKVPLVYGVPGKDVFGNEVPARNGNDLQVVLEDGVEEKEDGMKFYSTEIGRLVTVKTGDSQMLRISPIFEVKGNLDYSIGNIKFHGDVDIKGSVLAGFTVTAKGNIFVSDVIEEGARVEAGGNVEIKQGVVGKEVTHIKAGGMVVAKFLESAQVEAEGNVEVDNFMSNCTVVTSARVVMAKGKGTVIGGVISATEGIEVNVVGSDLGNPTHLIVGIDQRVHKELSALEAQAETLNGELDGINQSLGPGVNLKNVAYLKRLSPEMKIKIVDGLKRTRELTAKLDQITPKIQSLRRQMVKSVNDEPSIIQVNKMVYPPTTVTIRFQKRKINEVLNKVLIFEDLDAKEITWKVLSG